MNFIFFNPDEMRAESIGCWGHPLVSTPNMDQLAAEGTRFSEAHVTHTVCSPSRCSVLTGWHPHIRGHRSLYHLLAPDEPNLFRYLRKHGWQVVWYGKNDALSPESFPDSVDKYGSEPGRPAGQPQNPYPEDHPLYHSFLHEPRGGFEDTADYANVQKAIGFLQSQPSEPFAVYLPLIQPHPPYAAPHGYHDMYSAEDIPPLRPVCSQGKPDFMQRIRATRRLNELTEHQFRDINAKYLGSISYVDALLGQLLQTLDETGLADETAVIVWSDHGDWAGDYGLVEKWPAGLDDTLTHVPLIMRVPGFPSGNTVASGVQHFDIMPTVLELAGIPCEHSHFAQSLIPHLEGRPSEARRLLFAEGGYDQPHDMWCFEGRTGTSAESLSKPNHIYYPKIYLQQAEPYTVCRSVMVRSETHKLIRRTQQIHELYDLKRDPHELQNVYEQADFRSIRDELEQELLDWYLRTSDVTPWYEDPRGLPIIE